MLITAANIFVAKTGYRRAVIVEIETDAGISGIGEVGIAYGAGTQAAAAMAEEMLTRFVIGKNAAQIELIWNTIYDVGFWTKGGGAIAMAGLSGIEHALWDIKGKALGVPVYELFGGVVTDQLPVYANGWWHDCRTDDDYAEAAAAMVARGYRGLKYYPLGEHDPDTVIRHPSRRRAADDIDTRVYDRIARIRERVGERVDIMLDFGGGLTSDQLGRILKRIEPLNVAFIEEPVDPGLPRALELISRKTSIPLAAGERHYTRYGIHPILESGAVTIVQPDICNTGGLMEGRKIAALAEIYNARVAPHNYGSALATVIAAQLSACIPNFMVLECFPDFDKEPGFEPVIDDPLELRVRDGLMPLPTDPGLGATLTKSMRASSLWARVEPEARSESIGFG
ncbi:mandelate racemase/muconate lactonizing enzyme family protein [Pelagibius sp.]|uniref:mandelate racemase/muconate lactonizing enzyme family protein n=1 Tax=Pelagibius sp. TaxID=1931238 RepID=UPI002609619A|nr:mandelate racemase/muconate lactonizing enzyme family protein [Pelagibius sp.]